MTVFCPASVAAECAPATCRAQCAPTAIDRLLSERGAVSGSETDLLLDLRWHLRQRTDAEETLRLFCMLRRIMEQRHYLAFFRIRRWLENHILVAVHPCPAAEPVYGRLKLDHYCIEAVRRGCLCASLKSGVALLAPRVRFAFRPLPEHADAMSSMETAATGSPATVLGTR